MSAALPPWPKPRRRRHLRAAGPNSVLPCGTDSARRRHLAHGQECGVCGA
ncbi:hypothetical protein [Micromonospora sp. WMMD1082]|nr:hypothetical protein [Micromonospora sp. WMMD1082]MDG4796186.1 hypothetical protein [Micromonospora sp. WMMD1082]